MDRIKIKNLATIRPVPPHKQKKGVIKHKPLTDEEILARGWSLERAYEIRSFLKDLAERRAKTSSPRKNGKNASAA